MTYRVGSRASRLALVQVDEALGVLKNHQESPSPKLRFVLSPQKTFGDLRHDLSLLDANTPADLFTRELDEGLRSGKLDFVVHSAKDLDLPLAPDLALVALLPPADPTDALVCAPGLGPTLEQLPPGARIGTSSPARREGLLKVRPDLTIVGIRGTIEERLAQVDRGAYAAAVVATCALQRLGLEYRIGEILPWSAHPLQGTLAVTALKNRRDVASLWATVDVRRGWGRVFLVGAGPGDPELITAKASRLLREADLVLTDSLADPRLVRGLRAEVQFVGKRGDAGGELQAVINERLYRAVLEGRSVVRLKGGDPMIFGRASEEIEFLAQRLVPVETVPGVSSAQAASHYAGIPLTERGVSASVALCLGAPADRITVPSAETLVYYMASATLTTIVDRLVEAGKALDTPVALVRNASLPDQQVWRHTLGSLQEELRLQPEHAYASPLLLFVGAVARTGLAPAWFESLPRVWYAGTNADRYTRPCRLVHLPLVSIAPLADPGELDTKLLSLKAYRWVVFTSRHTVDAVFDRIDALGLDTRAFSGVRVAAVGRATAQQLRTRGLRADLVPDTESSEGLVAAFSDRRTESKSRLRPGERVLLPCSDQALPLLSRGLTELGAVVDRVDAYQNQPVEVAPGELDLAWFDEVVLTSPSTAREFHRRFPEPPETLLLVPMGAQTRNTLGQLFPGRPLGTDWLSPRDPWTRV